MSSNKSDAVARFEQIIHSSPDVAVDEAAVRDAIREVRSFDVDESEMRLLLFLSHLLRLMDALLTGVEPPRSYVTQFSRLWTRWPTWDDVPGLVQEMEALQRYYERIQLFSSNPVHRAEEPLLFDEEHLKDLTRSIYDRLRRSWLEAVIHAS